MLCKASKEGFERDRREQLTVEASTKAYSNSVLPSSNCCRRKDALVTSVKRLTCRTTSGGKCARLIELVRAMALLDLCFPDGSRKVLR